MARQMQRRPSIKRRDEEYAEDNNSGSQQQSQGRNSSSSVVTDLAKGFVEAQAKINSSDQEMMKLLRKISFQLENVQQTSSSSDQQQNSDENTTSQGNGQTEAHFLQQGNQQSSQQGNQQNGQQQSNQQNGQDNSQQNSDSQAAQELRMLFSKLLDTKQNSGNQSQANSNQSQASNNGNSSQNNSNQGSGQQFKTVTAQTAAQVLAQAQFELSKELDDSLKKLKQVISESEKLANRISSLLGEENTTNS